MAAVKHYSRPGFNTWYRTKGVTGSLRQRFELYLIMYEIY